MYSVSENITQNTYQVTVAEQGSTYSVTVNEEVNNYTIGFDRTIVLWTAIRDWWHYIGNVRYTGNDIVLTDGEVLECIYEETTIYRYIANDVDPYGYNVEDSFYQNFDGTNLDGLIKTRG